MIEERRYLLLILRRIRKIRLELKNSIILITHDIAVIAKMSDRIAVMYGSEIMEQASAVDLFENPHHLYTLGLKNAFPSTTTLGTELISIPGSSPTLWGRCKAALLSRVARSMTATALPPIPMRLRSPRVIMCVAPTVPTPPSSAILPRRSPHGCPRA